MDAEVNVRHYHFKGAEWDIDVGCGSCDIEKNDRPVIEYTKSKRAVTVIHKVMNETKASCGSTYWK
jgi:hypothetical protein